jgi:hypothetical protein
MKRFLFWFVAALAAVALIRSNHRPQTHPRPPRPFVLHHLGPDERTIRSVVSDGDRTVVVIDHSDRDEDDDRDDGVRPRRPGRVVVEGLPVPVVPGTRVDEARIEPPAPVPPAPPRPPRAPKRPKAHALVSRPVAPPRPDDATAAKKGVEGKSVKIPYPLATEERARKDARRQLEEKVAEWVAPEVPRTWKVPARYVDAMVQHVDVTPRERDYGTMYEAAIRADFAPERRAEIVAAYQHDETVEKLSWLGALLAFVLVCLAVLSGYIRADEATKGYYTNRLRLAAATGVGAAGVLLYHWLA